METPIQQRIQIDRLLMHREERLARIHSIEQRIENLLGQSYPFDPPPPRSALSAKKRKYPAEERLKREIVVRLSGC